tara:strand:+ start:69 stop:308 length:240 start_codon:yes stop_codon:yes gene_type:complete
MRVTSLNARNLTTGFYLCNKLPLVVVIVPRWRDSCSAASLEKLLHARCRNRQLSFRQARYSCWEVLSGHGHPVLLSLAS